MGCSTALETHAASWPNDKSPEISRAEEPNAARFWHSDMLLATAATSRPAKPAHPPKKTLDMY